MRGLFACSSVVLLAFASACGGKVVFESGGSTQASGAGGATGECATDADCESRASGCCEVCANLTDTLPPPMSCGVPCDPPIPCLCNAGHCVSGAAH